MLRARGRNINDFDLTPEWTVEWKILFDGEHAQKKSMEREKLLKKWNIDSKDIEWFDSSKQTVREKKAPEVISLIDSDDDSVVHLRTTLHARL